MAETLRLPYSVQGNGTVESIGNHLYQVCGPAGCTVVMGLSNALYLSATCLKWNTTTLIDDKKIAPAMERIIKPEQSPLPGSKHQILKC